ncbi:hypothetical protein [Phenylobacterium sp.]|uniref:terminase small subunit-like protein n=1 Tax=Phenylobacterium sp. TaxID=1871053 RepID=UPI00271A54BC|nr:hypothetical protein [Phenylobacterium sp.]MDO8380505.1 hypothetical protein [Phenylobacterium sp.]
MPEPPALAARAAMPAAPAVTYSPEVAEAICDLTVLGHSLAAICRRPGMPSSQSVHNWLRRRADFAQTYALALQVGGRPHREGEPRRYSLETAVEFCRRLGEGRALHRVCQDEDMPSQSAIYLWLNRHPEFVAMYANAREIQAERLFDDVREIADGATPETLAVDKTRIASRQWQAAKLAPRKYGTRIAQEHPDAVVFNVEIVKFGRDKPAQ